MDVDDFLWNMYNENTTQGRHHEVQRTTVVTVIVTLAGAILAFVSHNTLKTTWPLGAFLIVVGLFGALFTLKQTERARLHMTVATTYRKYLEDRLKKADGNGSTDTPGTVEAAASDTPASETAATGDGNGSTDTPGTVQVAVGDLTARGRQFHKAYWNWRSGRDDRRKPKQRVDKNPNDDADTDEEGTASADPRWPPPLYWFFIGMNFLVAGTGLLVWTGVLSHIP